MTWVRAGDPFGLVAYLSHFYSILKLLLVLLASFPILVVKVSFLGSYAYEIARGRIFIITYVQERGVAPRMSFYMLRFEHEVTYVAPHPALAYA